MSHPDRLALAVASRALDVPASGAILVLRAAPSAFLDLVPRDRLHCVQGFRPLHDSLAAVGLAVTAAVPEDFPSPAMAVVNLTRSRAENLGNVAAALGALLPDGTLVVTGAKGDGIDSLARQLARAIPLEGTFVKAHGRVVWLTRPAALPRDVAAWAAAAEPRRNPEGFLTAPGMFSPDHADPGSRRLAAVVGGRLSGRVADLGAGWGWLAQAVLAASPAIAELDLHEAEAIALDAARANVSDPRARFHWSDVARLGGTAPYDAVIANPPFHQDRAAQPELGVAFIAAAARILKPAGQLFLVANRQLPYEAALDAAFRDGEKLGEDAAYKVLRAARPRRT
ncbi:MAG TPA: methyltransferase [Amaricoccus sp.]|nr:methyltransferase [Amaricoccus sp.]